MKAESDHEANEMASPTDRIPGKRSASHGDTPKKGQKAQKTDVSHSEVVSQEQAIQIISEIHPLITACEDNVDKLHLRFGGMNRGHQPLQELQGFLIIIRNKIIELQKFAGQTADL